MCKTRENERARSSLKPQAQNATVSSPILPQTGGFVKGPFAFVEGGEAVELPEPRESECGATWRWQVDPVSGTRKPIAMFCGRWRDQECPRCFSHRQDELRDRLDNAVEERADVRFVGLRQAHESGLLGRLSAEDYLRMPEAVGPDGVEEGALLYAADAVGPGAREGTRVFYHHDIPGSRWDALTNTPRKKRISGDLGKADTDADRAQDPDWERVKVEQVTMCPPLPAERARHEARVREAWAEAVEETDYLDPVTVEQVEDACHVRLAAFEKALRRWKLYPLGRVTVRTWVRLSSIGWNGNNSLCGVGDRELFCDERAPGGPGADLRPH